MCYIFECIVIIVTFSLVWTVLLLFHRCPFSFNNQVHTGRFCSSFCLVVLAVDHSYRYLYTVCMRCCVCVFAILIWEMAMKNCFWTFQPTKGPIVFIALAFILLYKSFGLLDDRFQLCVCACVACLSISFNRTRTRVCMFDLFRHFGLTIAFVFNVGFVIWQKPFANNRQNAGNNIIKLMTSVNKILSLDENNFNKKK